MSSPTRVVSLDQSRGAHGRVDLEVVEARRISFLGNLRLVENAHVLLLWIHPRRDKLPLRILFLGPLLSQYDWGFGEIVFQA
jgi:hypothetical protein